MNETNEKIAEFQFERRRGSVVQMITSVIVLIMLGTVAVFLYNQSQTTQSLERVIVARAERINTLETALDEQRIQFLDCKNKPSKNNPYCSTPIVPPAKKLSKTLIIPRKLTAAEMLFGVSLFCVPRNDCRGPSGKRGAEGESIQGPQGDSIKGDKGDSIKGDKGDSVKGDKGDNGTNGRGVSSISCQSDGSWLISYTDGTSTTTSGPCRASTPAPTPKPAPTP